MGKKDRSRQWEELPPEEQSRVVHELEVHQLEVERLSEGLRRAQAKLTALKARYFERYDLAPDCFATRHQAEQSPQTSEEPSPAEPGYRARILLVEDDALIAMNQQMELERYGYQVVVAGTGEEAVELCASETAFDIVLMDVDLGAGMNGPEAATQILETYQVPVLFLSSHTEPEVVAKTERISSYGYVIKSLGISVLEASITMARRLFKANANLALEKEYLRESQERLAMFIQHSPICIYLKEVAERESRVLFASDNFVDMIGITGSEMIGKTMAELFPPEFADKITRDDWAVVSGNQVLTLDEEFNGRHYTSIKFPISQQNRKLLGGYTLEVTEKKLAVEKIEALLDDKEELLKEVHHRIKNNMYAIKNLLAIQASSVSEIAGRANLLEAASRVQSMMMLYDHLLQSSDYLSVSTRAFLSSLAEAVVADFAGDVPVALEMEIADCLLCSGKTQPLGLILNELLTNSMKHAFVGRSRGKVTVTFHVNDGRGMLAVMDDGTGLPDSINFESAPSLGLRLIHLLTKQIGGTVRSELGNGIRVIVEFSI